MTATTPDLPNIDRLGAFDSRYVNVAELPWKPTKWSGIWMKMLLEDKESGLMTMLMKWEPGTSLPLHEHVRIEQTFVLEGSLADDEGEVTAGNFVWRPQGSKHVATSPKGALILAFFLEPNRFIEAHQ